MAPLANLAEFVSHEQQFLSRLREHVSIQKSQIRELLPFVAWHFANYGTLAVNNFVMGERQHEIFGEAIEHAECK